MVQGSNELGARLRALRRGQNLTQEQLAQRARVTRDWISAIERGKIPNPGGPGGERLAQALGVSSHYLLTGATLSDDELYAEIEQISAELDGLLRRVRDVLRRAAVTRRGGR